VIYLTFDDGPSKYTEDILRILKEYNIKATFFVIPDESEECADRLRTIAAAGHTIGVHSYTHNYLTIYEDELAFVEDFAKAYDIIVKVTNQKPWLYRFPGGSVNQYNRHCRDGIKTALDERGFVYYDWNTDSNDWRGLSPEELCRNVTNDVKRFPSATVLMHDTDTRENTVEALENIIKCLKESGYKFAPITQTVEPIQYGVNF
ncbi:MAG: polysaccharide deacetylase, partial [Ruminiclostridium sp.]|nr:polysaccharide deacetylase [Ruminiclostridium sp.]